MAVYFMQPVSGGPVKIGYSENVSRRRERLEAHYGQPLAVLAVIDGDRKEEARIHAQFEHLRYHNRTGRGRKLEQFRPGAELMAFIGKPLLVDPNPDAVEAMPYPESGLKAVRLELCEETHRQLRIVAAEHGMSMAAFARWIVESYLTPAPSPTEAPDAH